LFRLALIGAKGFLAPIYPIRPAAGCSSAPNLDSIIVTAFHLQIVKVSRSVLPVFEVKVLFANPCKSLWPLYLQQEAKEIISAAFFSGWNAKRTRLPLIGEHRVCFWRLCQPFHQFGYHSVAKT